MSYHFYESFKNTSWLWMTVFASYYAVCILRSRQLEFEWFLWRDGKTMSWVVISWFVQNFITTNVASCSKCKYFQIPHSGIFRELKFLTIQYIYHSCNHRSFLVSKYYATMENHRIKLGSNPLGFQLGTLWHVMYNIEKLA